MRALWRHHLAWLLCLPLLSCSGEDSPDDGVLVVFEVFKDGQNVPCSALSDITSIEVSVLNESGLGVVPGYPIAGDCVRGQVSLTGLAAGTFVVEVKALGDLDGVESTLYRARSNFTLPSDTITLSLRPTVAFLKLGWTFGEDGLAPCATEVGEIIVRIAGGFEPYSDTFDCRDTPVTIDRPFAAQNYTIEVTAESPADFPVFKTTVQRLLETGDNEFTANLTPLGGQLLFDWDFKIDTDFETRDCDAARVLSTEITATIRFLEGGQPPIVTSIPCASVRPYVFEQARFTEGRRLGIELRSEAEELFFGERTVAMPDGDFELPEPIIMEAVGTATLSIEVSTASCSDRVDEYVVRLTPPETPGDTLYETRFAWPDTEASLLDVPYREYLVEVTQMIGLNPACQAREIRIVDQRVNTWDPLRF